MVDPHIAEKDIPERSETVFVHQTHRHGVTIITCSKENLECIVYSSDNVLSERIIIPKKSISTYLVQRVAGIAPATYQATISTTDQGRIYVQNLDFTDANELLSFLETNLQNKTETVASVSVKKNKLSKSKKSKISLAKQTVLQPAKKKSNKTKSKNKTNKTASKPTTVTMTTDIVNKKKQQNLKSNKKKQTVVKTKSDPPSAEKEPPKLYPQLQTQDTFNPFLQQHTYPEVQQRYMSRVCVPTTDQELIQQKLQQLHQQQNQQQQQQLELQKHQFELQQHVRQQELLNKLSYAPPYFPSVPENEPLIQLTELPPPPVQSTAESACLLAG